MIYDTFIFFNELDLLKIRLEELKDAVDKFILVESPHTHAGRAKPLYFQEYRHEFKDYLDRIVYYCVQGPSSTGGSDLPAAVASDRRGNEMRHRNTIAKALEKCNCSPDDIILMSDVDEIPRASTLHQASLLLDANDFVVFDQKFYIYYLNFIHRDAFCGTVACKYSTLSGLAGDVDSIRWGWGPAKRLSTRQRSGAIRRYADRNYPHIQRGGWHFTSFGGFESVLYKAQNYAHEHFDKTEEKKLEYVKNNICRSNLHNDRKLRGKFHHLQMGVHTHYRHYREIPLFFNSTVTADEDLPEYLKHHIEKFPHFFKLSEPNEAWRIAIANHLRNFICWTKIMLRLIRTQVQSIFWFCRSKLRSGIKLLLKKLGWKLPAR